MKLAWGNKVTEAFRSSVLRIASGIGINPSWLMACMAFETGRTFDPAVRNPASSATGLIQFMGGTAQMLGTTTDTLARMTAVEQLEYVRRYFAPYAGKLKTLSDTYMAILWPAAIGGPENAPIFDGGGKAYLANKGLDVNKDGAVTKLEAAAHVAKLLDEGLLPTNVWDIEEYPAIAPQTTTEETKPMIPALIVGLVQTLIGAFQPLAQQKLSSLLEQKTGAPSAIADTVVKSVMDITLKATGLQPGQEVEAVAAAKQSPQLVQQIEAHTLASLAQLEPIFEKINSYEQQAWAADTAGRNAASDRAAKDKTDLAPLLAKSNLGMTAGIVFGCLVMLGVSMWYSDNHEPSVALVGLVGPFLGQILGYVKDIVAYRFDGTHRSDAASAAKGAASAV